jgi:serine/threonine protein kinase
MGTVFLADDTQLHRQVALKIPKFTADDGPDFIERFYCEARSAATLRNPNICPVFDVDEINGTHYITMAYIEGKPLSDYIIQDKLQSERNVALMVRKLALGLQDAHSKGIIHRDLKPANIMIDEKGEPVIMDFGLARQIGKDDNERLTKSGAIVGTPAYMSPEQVEGDLQTVGPTSDIYSLGVILYELLTSELPFQGSLAAVLGQIMTQEPEKPSELRPDVEPRLEAICLKMMAKAIENRYESMSEVADALARVIKSPSNKSTKSVVQKSSQGEQEPFEAKRSTQRRSADFDPYHKWLGIPKQKQPPTFYELLGISLDEEDDEVIRSTAERQRTHIEQFEGGAYHEETVELLYQIDEAELTLLSPKLRRDYDRRLDLFRKRKKRRQVDPVAGASPSYTGGRTVGEESGFFREYLGIMSVILGGFIIMAVVSFMLPWRKYIGPDRIDNADLVQHTSEPSEGTEGKDASNNDEQPATATNVVRPPFLERGDIPPGEVRVFRGHKQFVTSVAFSPNGRQAVSGSGAHHPQFGVIDASVRVWNIESGKELWVNNDSNTEIIAVTFSSDGSSVFACSEDAFFKMNASTGKTLNRFSTRKSKAADFNDAKQLLAVFDGTRNCSIYDLTTKKETSVWARQGRGTDFRPVISFDKNDALVFFGAPDSIFEHNRFGRADAERRTVINSSSRLIRAFDVGGSHFLTGGSDGVVRLWHRGTGTIVREFRGHDEWLYSVAFSPDGRLILSGGGGRSNGDWYGRPKGDTALRLWSVDSGEELYRFEGHRGAALALTFSRNGKFALSGSSDNTVRLWKVPDYRRN